MASDLISRKAVLDEISKVGVVSLGTVLECLSNAPTVEAMPLPCRLGDPVYIIINLANGKPSHIVERKCTGIHITEAVFGHRAERASRYLVTNSDIGFAQHIPFTKIGKTVFFIRKEAEAAIAERMVKDGK